jgi:acyl-coenzyme A thioesterase PaaI-like protein
MNKIIKQYNQVKKLPFGNYLFTKSVCFVAPYFASIKPLITDLQHNRVEVKMKNRRSVRNHFKSVHAIAMCNMAELAGGLMTDVSVQKGCRWIPKGMTVKYMKKAMTDLTATADGSEVDWSVSGDIEVPVVLVNTKQETVFEAIITMNLKHSI